MLEWARVERSGYTRNVWNSREKRRLFKSWVCNRDTARPGWRTSKFCKKVVRKRVKRAGKTAVKKKTGTIKTDIDPRVKKLRTRGKIWSFRAARTTRH